MGLPAISFSKEGLVIENEGFSAAPIKTFFTFGLRFPESVAVGHSTAVD